MPMKPCLAAAISFVALGCAPEVVTVAAPASPTAAPPASPPAQPTATPTPPPGVAPEKLPVTALAGPYPSVAAACAAAEQASGAPSAACTSAPIVIQPGPSFTAAILHAPDASDPRYAGSGAFFLALNGQQQWFVATPPVDRINGAAGHMYLPEVTSLPSFGTTSAHGAARALIRLRNVVTRVCNACTGPDHDKREPVQTKALWVVCGVDRAGKLACTAPVEADEQAGASLANDVLTVTPPGGATKHYALGF